MTTINTFEDILQAMEQNPALLEMMRRHILTEELLRLPAIVAKLQEDVSKLQEDVAKLQEDVAKVQEDVAKIQEDVAKLQEDVSKVQKDVAKVQKDVAKIQEDVSVLKEGQARLENRAASLENGQTRMSGQLNMLIGDDYERSVAKSASRAVRRYLGVQRAELLHSMRTAENNHVNYLLEEATEEGRITDDQADEVDKADLVLRGHTGDGETVYVVAEVSVTVDEHDINRAADRAAILERASGAASIPAVIGKAISPANARNAQGRNVTFIPLGTEPEPAGAAQQ